MWKKILNILKNPLFILAIIFIVGLVLRLLEINRTSFWYDEAFTGDVLKMSWKDMFAVIAADKVHPPLFYVIARVWASIFGFTQESLRGLSIFFGLGTSILGYFVGKNLFDKKRFPIVGLVIALAIAISPFFIAYSNEARSYSFLALLALGLAFTVIKWLDSKEKLEKRKYLIISLILGISLCATHYLQIVFIIAVICTVLIYKFVFTEKGLNKKGLWRTLGVILLAILGILFLPIKAFLLSHDISGMWWITDVKLYEVVRVYYSYFLGVVRYMDGVPPMRDLIVDIPQLLLAGSLFLIQLLSYVYILVSKRFSTEEKRHITFFYVLGIVTFLGFYILSAIGFNSFVERYTIAGGIVLFVSFWITIASVLRNWFVLVPIGIYVSFILMLTPVSTRIDYREVAKTLDGMNNVHRYVFTSPTDLIDSQFYMSHTNVYYYYEYTGKYPGWALLKDDVNGVYMNDIQEGDILIAPDYEVQKFRDLGYIQVSSIGSEFTILSK